MLFYDQACAAKQDTGYVTVVSECRGSKASSKHSTVLDPKTLLVLCQTTHILFISAVSKRSTATLLSLSILVAVTAPLLPVLVKLFA